MKKLILMIPTAGKTPEQISAEAFKILKEKRMLTPEGKIQIDEGEEPEPKQK